MKSPTILAVILLCGNQSQAWVTQVNVKAAPRPATVENPPLTPEDLRQLYHFDDPATKNKMRQSSPQQGAVDQPLTSQDRAQLWKLDQVVLHDSAAVQPSPYTQQDRAALWKLSDVQQSLLCNKNVQQHQQPYTFAQMEEFNRLPERAAALEENKNIVHQPYTCQDRAELWSLHQPNKYTKQVPKWNILTDQDRHLLWHMDDDSQLMHDEHGRHEPYTSEDRQHMFDLKNNKNKSLQDETKRQRYTDQDRANLWHVQRGVPAARRPEPPTMSHHDHAQMWNLPRQHAHNIKMQNQQHGGFHRQTPYTSDDRKNLWQL